MEIYDGKWGRPLRWACTYLIPVLVVVNVPARLIAQPLSGETAWLAVFAVAATALSLLASRLVFLAALRNYRSASS
jgi:ABC-2 type transport system permease protein